PPSLLAVRLETPDDGARGDDGDIQQVIAGDGICLLGEEAAVGQIEHGPRSVSVAEHCELGGGVDGADDAGSLRIEPAWQSGAPQLAAVGGRKGDEFGVGGVQDDAAVLGEDPSALKVVL